jgi:3-methyladenine DNA glycosylase/8-oxoguanine DNA glycosylase
MRSVEITTPFPTVEEIARRSGVSPKRARELVRLAKAIVAGDLDKKPPASVGAARKKSSAVGNRGAKPARRK